ncbi:MAG: DUF481 domain-containing protein [Bacteroidia bacterium]|nr:DUF481 domain-containing protein [Bacteroidia bacterium]
MWRFAVFILICLSNLQAAAQLIYTESFTPLPYDSTKCVIGAVSGSIQSQKQKNVFFQFSERADLSMRFRHHYAFTVANSFDIIRDGNKTVLSGGYIFGRFYRHISKPVSVMYFGQYQWFAIRGLDQRMSGGPNLFFRLISQKKQTLHAGAGVMAEYEKWNYNAVPAEKRPAVINPVEILATRWNTFVSYDIDVTDVFSIDAALYYQTGFVPGFERTRIGTHTRFGWKISRHLRLFSELYTLYEYKTVVPIDPLWYRVNTNLSYYF